jgi:ornithine cyclodeaminase
VEFEPQSRIEGELQQMPADFAVVELWQVLSGAAPGRRGEDEVTVFDSVGFALEDFSALRYLDEQFGVEYVHVIDLVPELADPKNLYGAAIGITSLIAPALLVKELQ